MFVRACPSSFKRPPFSRRARKTHKQAHCWKDGKLAKAGGLSPAFRFRGHVSDRWAAHAGVREGPKANKNWRRWVSEWLSGSGPSGRVFPAYRAPVSKETATSSPKRRPHQKTLFWRNGVLRRLVGSGPPGPVFPAYRAPVSKEIATSSSKRQPPSKKHRFGEMGFCDGWLVRGLLDPFSPAYRAPV